MATHSSVLAWRIPGTGNPDGLPSMGSHRVGHDWSDLAAAVGIDYVNSNIGQFHCFLWIEKPILCVCVCWFCKTLVSLALIHWLGIAVWCWIYTMRKDIIILFSILLTKHSIFITTIINVDLILFPIYLDFYHVWTLFHQIIFIISWNDHIFL